MFYLPYLCLFSCNGVQFILCCNYVLFWLSSSCILCTLCCLFLWIVPSSCVPYVASFSGLSLRLVYPLLPVSLDCPFVLGTLCYQFLWIVPSVFSHVYFLVKWRGRSNVFYMRVKKQTAKNVEYQSWPLYIHVIYIYSSQHIIRHMYNIGFIRDPMAITIIKILESIHDHGKT
jgi:hypothetical protein